MSPADAIKPENEDTVWRNKYSYLRDMKPKKSKFKVGMKVTPSKL